ncbi:MAG: hypothetical protein A3F41_00345 [Coxiella sp. RIFCSPHIGHO2_12_FULL_44_14]|nr:MAG: hypothetical protein A3F41_00345 [Coxiella sp. RIFCSPHIGHO2_12_FULL_44_14]
MRESSSWKILGLKEIAQSKNLPTTFIVGVSIGDRKLEGSQFLALMRKINELSKSIDLRFCFIAICDTLQRYNYMIDGKINEEVALATSARAGEIWIKKNSESLQELHVPYKIIRWSEWQERVDFKSIISRVEDAYNEDSNFKMAVNQSAMSFSSRFKKRYEEANGKEACINIDESLLQECCRRYLIEESAVIMHYWPEYESATQKIILYPGRMTAALEIAYEKFVHQKSTFQWKKYRFKEVASTECLHSIPSTLADMLNKHSPVNFLENFEGSDKKVFLVSLAAYTSIMQCQHRPLTEILYLLENYTKFLLDKAESIEMPESVLSRSLFYTPQLTSLTTRKDSSSTIQPAFDLLGKTTALENHS